MDHTDAISEYYVANWLGISIQQLDIILMAMIDHYNLGHYKSFRVSDGLRTNLRMNTYSILTTILIANYLGEIGKKNMKEVLMDKLFDYHKTIALLSPDEYDIKYRDEEDKYDERYPETEECRHYFNTREYRRW